MNGRVPSTGALGIFFLVLGGLLLILPPGVAGQDPVRSVGFEAEVYPIFEKACHDCHGSKVQRAAKANSLASSRSGIRCSLLLTPIP